MRLTAETTRFQALDFGFTVRGPADLVAYLDALFADLRRPGESYARYVVEGGTLTLHDAALGAGSDVVRALVHDVNLRADNTSIGTVNVHAGVVAEGGRALLLCGPSGSGKSTLVAALARRGLGYASDELAAVDLATTNVRPYPKPLLLKPGAHHLFPDLAPETPWGNDTWAVRAGAAVTTDLPIGRIVFPRYAPGEPARLEPVSRAEAVTLLGGQTSRLTSYPDVLGVLTRIVTGPAVRLVFGDLDAAVAALR